jgi:SnoaL-like domain
MPSVNQTLVRRFFDETCNQGKLEVADEIFSPDHKYHDLSNPFIVPGPEGMKLLISTYQRAFTGAHWEIEEMIDAGDRVVTSGRSNEHLSDWKTGTGYRNLDSPVYGRKDRRKLECVGHSGDAPAARGRCPCATVAINAGQRILYLTAF